MKITVKYDPSSYMVQLDNYGQFKCIHEDVTIEPPCCSGYDQDGNIDCGCYGQYSVYCNSCRNQDMNQEEASLILEREYA